MFFWRALCNEICCFPNHLNAMIRVSDITNPCLTCRGVFVDIHRWISMKLTREKERKSLFFVLPEWLSEHVIGTGDIRGDSGFSSTTQISMFSSSPSLTSSGSKLSGAECPESLWLVVPPKVWFSPVEVVAECCGVVDPGISLLKQGKDDLLSTLCKAFQLSFENLTYSCINLPKTNRCY